MVGEVGEKGICFLTTTRHALSRSAVHSSSMSFLIIVEPLDIPAPEMPQDNFLLGEWFEQLRAWWLYEKHLGDFQTMSEYWFLPSKQLGLTLMSFMDERIEISAPEELEQFSKELDTLEAHWHTLRLPEWPPDFLETRLLEPMRFLREAICVALEHRAVLIGS